MITNQLNDVFVVFLSFQYNGSVSHTLASTCFQKEFNFRWNIDDATLLLRDCREQIRSPAFTVPRVPCRFYLNASMAPAYQKGAMWGNGDLQLSTFWCNVPSSRQYELSLSLECVMNQNLDSTQLVSISRSSSVTVPPSNYKVLASKFSFSVVNHLAAVQAQTAYCNRTFINNGDFKKFSDIIKIQDEKFDQCLHNGTLNCTSLWNSKFLFKSH